MKTISNNVFTKLIDNLVNTSLNTLSDFNDYHKYDNVNIEFIINLEAKYKDFYLEIINDGYNDIEILGIHDIGNMEVSAFYENKDGVYTFYEFSESQKKQLVEIYDFHAKKIQDQLNELVEYVNNDEQEDYSGAWQVGE